VSILRPNEINLATLQRGPKPRFWLF